MSEKKYVVAKEVAEVEFDRFIEDMDLDFDESAMDQEELRDYLKHKNKIIKSIMRGDLVINESGEPVYTPRNPGSGYKDPITFHERTGASLIAMDGKKDSHNVGKMYAVLSNLCKIHAGNFSKLQGVDIKVCEALFVLLMD